MGFLFHLIYTATIMVYVQKSYLTEHSSETTHIYSNILGGTIAYAFLYAIHYLYLNGVHEYINDLWHWGDIIYIVSSVINVIVQDSLGPYKTASKVNIMIVCLMLIVKTFFFMRIID